jgi:predicted RecA/RadA family phage recombinase
MRNFIQPGNSLAIAVPYATGVGAGQGVLVGALFGVAAVDGVQNAMIEAATQGVFDLTKEPALAIGAGVRVFWDNIHDPDWGLCSLYIDRSQLVVRHAELTRFEAAQGAVDAPPPTMQLPTTLQVAGRGAPAKYKWDDFYCALAVMTHAEGIPETQTELTRRMMDWFAKQNLYPDLTTVKRKVATFWRQYHEAIARNPA